MWYEIHFFRYEFEYAEPVLSEVLFFKSRKELEKYLDGMISGNMVFGVDTLSFYAGTIYQLCRNGVKRKIEKFRNNVYKKYPDWY
ncbi:MAG TPA: hypothetical protein P5262_00390 [Candidatus Moranbacteria bacterium]|nr:hypothetical protein [Candidatus Moranbacteria bacterium]